MIGRRWNGRELGSERSHDLIAVVAGADVSRFSEAIAALEAIERLGSEGTRTERYQKFVARFGELDDA
jgi:hypothetical protein